MPTDKESYKDNITRAREKIMENIRQSQIEHLRRSPEFTTYQHVPNPLLATETDDSNSTTEGLSEDVRCGSSTDNNNNNNIAISQKNNEFNNNDNTNAPSASSANTRAVTASSRQSQLVDNGVSYQGNIVNNNNNNNQDNNDFNNSNNTNTNATAVARAFTVSGRATPGRSHQENNVIVNNNHGRCNTRSTLQNSNNDFINNYTDTATSVARGVNTAASGHSNVARSHHQENNSMNNNQVYRNRYTDEDEATTLRNNNGYLNNNTDTTAALLVARAVNNAVNNASRHSDGLSYQENNIIVNNNQGRYTDSRAATLQNNNNNNYNNGYSCNNTDDAAASRGAVNNNASGHSAGNTRSYQENNIMMNNYQSRFTDRSTLQNNYGYNSSNSTDAAVARAVAPSRHSDGMSYQGNDDVNNQILRYSMDRSTKQNNDNYFSNDAAASIARAVAAHKDNDGVNNQNRFMNRATTQTNNYFSNNNDAAAASVARAVAASRYSDGPSHRGSGVNNNHGILPPIPPPIVEFAKSPPPTQDQQLPPINICEGDLLIYEYIAKRARATADHIESSLASIHAAQKAYRDLVAIQECQTRYAGHNNQKQSYGDSVAHQRCPDPQREEEQAQHEKYVAGFATRNDQESYQGNSQADNSQQEENNQTDSLQDCLNHEEQLAKKLTANRYQQEQHQKSFAEFATRNNQESLYQDFHAGSQQKQNNQALPANGGLNLEELAKSIANKHRGEHQTSVTDFTIRNDHNSYQDVQADRQQKQQNNHAIRNDQNSYQDIHGDSQQKQKNQAVPPQGDLDIEGLAQSMANKYRGQNQQTIEERAVRNYPQSYQDIHVDIKREETNQADLSNDFLDLDELARSMASRYLNMEIALESSRKKDSKKSIDSSKNQNCHDENRVVTGASCDQTTFGSTESMQSQNFNGETRVMTNATVQHTTFGSTESTENEKCNGETRVVTDASVHQASADSKQGENCNAESHVLTGASVHHKTFASTESMENPNCTVETIVMTGANAQHTSPSSSRKVKTETHSTDSDQTPQKKNKSSLGSVQDSSCATAETNKPDNEAYTIFENLKFFADSHFITVTDVGTIQDSLLVSLAQFEPCSLEDDDRIGRYKHQEIGYIGLCCKWCMGQPGYGRYFPSTPTSFISSFPTTAVKHIGEDCPGCPQKIKEIVCELDRTNQKSPAIGSVNGGSKRLMERIWNKLRATNIEDATSHNDTKKFMVLNALVSPNVDNITWKDILGDSELVLIEDYGLVPNTMYAAFAQLRRIVIDGKVTENNMESEKNNKSLDRICLVCRFCRGRDDSAPDSRLYPSTKVLFEQVETTNKVKDHVLKNCPKCPPEIRHVFGELEAKEISDRRRYGSRKMFFQRIWDRMSGENLETNMNKSSDDTCDSDSEGSDEEEEDDVEIDIENIISGSKLLTIKDRGMVSDAQFVSFAQLMPCTLTQADQCGWYKDREIGFPGLCCRYCSGKPSSGRYFPQPSDLFLRNSKNSVMRHLINVCPSCPDAIRRSLKKLAKREKLRSSWKIADDSALGAGKLFHENILHRLYFLLNVKLEHRGGYQRPNRGNKRGSLTSLDEVHGDCKRPRPVNIQRDSVVTNSDDDGKKSRTDDIKK